MIHSLSFLFIWLSTLLWHPVHVTVSSAEYIANKQELTFSVKFFYDDLETIINQKYQSNLKLLPQNKVAIKELELMQQYINENLVFTINKHPKKAKILKAEYNYDAIWIYLKIDKIVAVNSLKIKNTLMTDLFRDQTNLFIYKDEMHEIGTQFDFGTHQKTLF